MRQTRKLVNQKVVRKAVVMTTVQVAENTAAYPVLFLATPVAM